MADIDLEIQTLTKANDPKPDPKNPVQRLSLTLQKQNAAAAAKVRFYIPTTSDGQRVQPAPDTGNANDHGPAESGSSPSDHDNEPKVKGKSRLKLILIIIAALVVVVGLANFILWVVINPRKMKFYVTDATLTEFGLSDDYTLRYNIRLNFTVRNPNKRIGFRYESVVGGAYYDGEKFDSGNLLSFYQPPKTTSGLETWFSGVKSLSSLGWDGVEGFKEQKSYGVYPIDVKIRVYSSIKIGKIHMGDFKVKVKCALKIPLITQSQSSGDGAIISGFAGFKTTQCHVDFNPLLVISSD